MKYYYLKRKYFDSCFVFVVKDDSSASTYEFITAKQANDMKLWNPIICTPCYNSKKRPGTIHLYTLQEGEKWAFYKGSIIVIHPDRPPKIVHPDGKVEELELIQ